MIDIPEGVVVRPLLDKTRGVPTYYCLVDDLGFDDGLPWYHDIYQFLRFGTCPKVKKTNDKRDLRQLATHFVIC